MFTRSSDVRKIVALYIVFYKKWTPFLSFIIDSYDEQLTKKLPVVAEKY